MRISHVRGLYIERWIELKEFLRSNAGVWGFWLGSAEGLSETGSMRAREFRNSGVN